MPSLIPEFKPHIPPRSIEPSLVCAHSEQGICLGCAILEIGKMREDFNALSTKCQQFYDELQDERRKVTLIKKKLMRILTI